MTPDGFKGSKFRLGPFAKYFYAAAAFFNTILIAVEVSPFFFPVTAETFNFVGPPKHN
jgi:translation initiation factor 5B